MAKAIFVFDGTGLCQAFGPFELSEEAELYLTRNGFDKLSDVAWESGEFKLKAFLLDLVIPWQGKVIVA